MGIWAACFLENGRFFDKIWAWEQWFFPEKSGKKGIILTFLAHPNKSKKCLILQARALKMIDITGVCFHVPSLKIKRKLCQNYTITILLVKKVKRIPFFSDLPKNHYLLSCSYFIKKNVQILENTLLSCPYFLKKTTILTQKHSSFKYFFSKFSWKTPCCHVHIWLNKRQFCQKYALLWAKKVNRMPFFLIFHEKKNNSSYANILSKT